MCSSLHTHDIIIYYVPFTEILRGIKYLSNFTWLLFLILFWGIFTLFKYNLNWLLLLDYISEGKKYFLLLTILFQLKSTLHLYFILSTLNMVNGSSNMPDVRTNDHWFHASSTQFHFRYDFHQVNVSFKRSPSNLRKHIEVAKLCSPKKFIHYAFYFDGAIRCVIYWLNAQAWVQIKSVQILIQFILLWELLLFLY